MPSCYLLNLLYSPTFIHLLHIFFTKILGHPNVKLFITQGGLLSSQEAVYCGIPMLLLPQFADQHYNSAALVKSGATVSLKLRTTTSEALSNALNKLLSDE